MVISRHALLMTSLGLFRVSRPMLTFKFSDQLASGISMLSLEIAAFLLLALALNLKDVTGVVRGMFPAAFHVNVLCFFVEILLIVPVLSFLFVALHDNMQFISSPLQGVWTDLPKWVVVCSILVVADGVSYFRHRVEHTRWLWPVHSMHHSDRAMSWFTLYRQHPLNRLLALLIDAGILLAIGFPMWALIVNSWIRHYYGLMTHANVPWTFGPFGRLLVSPAMHRWHHVREGEGVGSNFATLFSVFDQLFGTYYVPAPCRSSVGLNEPGHSSYLQQLWRPFRDVGRGLRRLSSPVGSISPDKRERIP